MTDGFDALDHQQTIPGGPEGKLLAGRYRIIRKLGEGGMGMVYLAEDAELNDTKVAVKFIPPVLAGNARAIKNLCREARVAMQLSHPNIVRLHDLHTDGHQKFLVMEYIEGKLAPGELLPIARQIAEGLDYAHGKGVLHRDLKPSNIMVARDGEAKLLDFGIAREIRDSYTRVTGQETSGTLPYMSPQQLRGDKPTASMDIYSFAAVLYECLAGCTPFHSGDIGHQILNKCPPLIDHVSERTNAALQSALAKNCDERPAAARELVEALEGSRQPAPRPSENPTPKTQSPPVAHGGVTRTAGRLWIVIILAGALIAGAFVFNLVNKGLTGRLLVFLAILPAATIMLGVISRRPVVSSLSGISAQVAGFAGYYGTGRAVQEGELSTIIFLGLVTGALGAGSAALARRWAAKRDPQRAIRDESTHR